MFKENESLFMKDYSYKSSEPQNTHKPQSKHRWCKIVFRETFKILEKLLVVLQFIQCICELMKR